MRTLAAPSLAHLAVDLACAEMDLIRARLTRDAVQIATAEKRIAEVRKQLARIEETF